MSAGNNPFRTARLDALRFRPQGADWPALMGRLEALGWRGAFVGPEGRGKTAALEELARRLTQEGWRVVFLRAAFKQRWPSRGMLLALRESSTAPRRESSPDGAPPRVAILLDSAEQFSAPGWLLFRFFARHCAALVIATHEPGRLPTLLACETSPALLEELAAELTKSSVSPTSLDTHEILSRNDGNLRNALLELYDRWADRSERIKSTGQFNPASESAAAPSARPGRLF